MENIEKQINAEINLPSPPAIAVRILEAVKREENTFEELASIISSDPALTVRILKVANSSYYALPTKVDSVQRALAILGVNALKNIALSFIIAGELHPASEDAFDYDRFWKMSVTAAVSAELVASHTGQKDEDAFVKALLQDIGIVVMYLSKPDLYAKVLEEKRITGKPIETIEQTLFGCDHQQVGRLVLKQWGLPASIYDPVGCHHYRKYDRAKHSVANDILLLSNLLSACYHGIQSSARIQRIQKILTTRYEMDPADIEGLIDAVAVRSIEAMSFFDIDPGEMKPFSEMLQEANAELGRLNISYEHLVIELKKAKEEAEKLARELQAANVKLRDMALRDGLTGLYNHRYFHELLETEVRRAIRYKRSYSLIMFDLDHFKQVNDTFGHLAGDTVLAQVGQIVSDCVRSSDLAARYGGEEFVVLLPETDLKGAVILAERLRKTIEDAVFHSSDQEIRITISIGISIMTAQAPVENKAQLLAAADEALYKSKRGGRNKISFSGSATK
ncbi:MAG: GGDEF domain-containing protein [Desulfosarcinaceae bacterium]|nr:GGDEF domain-containing protein [Desulfosarcinaceae bacterium]